MRTVLFSAPGYDACAKSNSKNKFFLRFSHFWSRFGQISFKLVFLIFYWPKYMQGLGSRFSIKNSIISTPFVDFPPFKKKTRHPRRAQIKTLSSKQPSLITIQMYYTKISLTSQQYEMVRRLCHTDDQVSDRHIYSPNEVPAFPNMSAFRVFNCRWKLLAVHELNHPTLRYQFVVTILCQYRNNRKIIWRIHHSQRVPFICITYLNSTQMHIQYPCVFFHFRDILDAQKTQPLDDYLSTLPYGFYSVDDS
jgi:hypothetical protein